MRKLILLLLVLIPFAGMNQKIAEVSISNKDYAVGLSYVDLSNHFIVGAESGLYRYTMARIKHQKYKAGYVLIQKEILYNKNDLIWTASICYNHYKEIYNYGKVKKLPMISCEFGFRAELTKFIYTGAHFDPIHGAGGFNVGFVIFK